MAHRTFTDSGGIEWEVWQVIPRGVSLDSPERRERAERRHPPASELPEIAEQRSGRERRRTASVSPGMELGWLAFQTRGEKRRLAPIPDGWEALTSAQLEAYCRIARKVGS